MKKKIGTIGMALSFSGCLLGAGYVSGQELWQYFGNYGAIGIVGLGLAIFLTGLISVFVLRIAEKTRRYTMGEIIVRKRIPALEELLNVLCTLLYFGIATIMLSGIASLGEEWLGVPRLLCAAIATVPVMACVYFGIQGMVAVFERAVPCLILFTIAISIVRICDTGTEAVRFAGGETNPLLGNWFFSSLNYAALNIFGSIGILAPLIPYVKKKTVSIFGILLGCVALVAIALAILAALSTLPSATGFDLPMLELAGTMGPVYQSLYGILLFLGMFGNAVATMVASLGYLKVRLPGYTSHRGIYMVVLGILAYGAACCGFGDLVGTVYPLIGYFGLVVMVLVTEHFFFLYGKSKLSSKNT